MGQLVEIVVEKFLLHLLNHCIFFTLIAVNAPIFGSLFMQSGYTIFGVALIMGLVLGIWLFLAIGP